MRLTDPDIKRIRAMKAIQMRIEGKTLIEIGKALNISDDSAGALIQWGRSEGLTKEYEARVIEDLVPLAINVYLERLKEDKDAYVAKDVIDKLFKLGDRYSGREQAAEAQGLAAYLAERRTLRQEVKTVGKQAADIDIEVLNQSDDIEEDFQPAVEPPVTPIKIIGAPALPAQEPHQGAQ